MEKPKAVIPTSEPELAPIKEQESDPETRPGPATQAHREGHKKEVVPTPEAFIQLEDFIFEECPVGRDLERPHENRSLMSKWVGKVLQSKDNPAYAFNQTIANPEEYKKMPYMPQLMGLIRPKITEVLQTELHRKDQIKLAIVALYLYSITKRNPDGTSDTTYIEK